jgi:hypothetical protein
MRDKLGRIIKGSKFSEEHKKKISIALKGKIKSESFKKNQSIAQKQRFAKNTVWNKGLHRKLSDSGWKKGHIPWNKGLKRIDIIGKNNWNWKGGVTTLYNKIRRCFEMRQWRSDIFTRDNFTCQICGDKNGGNLEAHHIKEFSKILSERNIKTFDEALLCEELWNLNNGITLCEKCHIKKHH